MPGSLDGVFFHVGERGGAALREEADARRLLRVGIDIARHGVPTAGDEGLQ